MNFRNNQEQKIFAVPRQVKIYVMVIRTWL